MRGLSQGTLALALAAVLAVPAAQADDPNPPVFKGATVGSGPYGPGDEVPIGLSWEDESGLQRVSGSVQGPAGLWVHLECEDPEGQRVVTVACIARLHPRTPGGTYRLSWVNAQDVIGHHASAPAEGAFTVDSPFRDTEGPALTSLEQKVNTLDVATLQRQWNSIHVDDAFRIQASDASNVSYASLSFVGPGNNQALHVQCDAWSAQASACRLFADPEVPAGDFVLRDIHVSDEIGYHSLYVREPWPGGQARDLDDIVAGPVVIRVVSEHVDDAPPVLTGLTFPGELHRGQPFELWLNATDETVVEGGQVMFQTTRGNAGYSVWHAADCTGAPAANRTMHCTGRFPGNFPLGLAIVDWVFVEDAARNHGWARPVEWSHGHVPGHSFRDDAAFDVGTVLMPRPIEGVLEAVDVVVNELLPGDVATIVYQTEDQVDEVELVLQDAVDGSKVEVTCLDAVTTALGEECSFTVPADEDGLLSLVRATTSGAGVEKSSTYAAGAVPLLAVAGSMPSRGELAQATGGGPANRVGADWVEAFRAEAQRGAALPSAQPGDAGATTASGSSTASGGGPSGGVGWTATGPGSSSADTAATPPPPPTLRPATEIRGLGRTATSAQALTVQPDPPAPSPAPRQVPAGGGTAQESPGAALGAVLAMVAAAATLRRRA